MFLIITKYTRTVMIKLLLRARSQQTPITWKRITRTEIKITVSIVHSIYSYRLLRFCSKVMLPSPNHLEGNNNFLTGILRRLCATYYRHEYRFLEI
jgi:hypothetical protein